MQDIMSDIAKLRTFNHNQENYGIGFNSQEEEAYYCGYFENSPKLLPNYLPAKLRLLQAIDKAKEENKRILLNAARIYSYTLFENTWLGHLIACADSQENVFTIKDTEGKEKPIKKSYLNHLPSFSSAILHFGTCRDLFFPLLKLFLPSAEINSYVTYGKKSVLTKDLESAFSSDVNFIAKGEKFFDLNIFRNLFAHQFRVLWWENKQSKESGDNIFFIKKDFYDSCKAISTKYDDKVERKLAFEKLAKEINTIINDPAKYQNDIYGESDLTKLVSSKKILQEEIYKTIVEFLNSTFEVIHEKKDLRLFK